MHAPRPRILMITGRADPGGGPEHLYQLAQAVGRDCEVFIATPNEAPYWDRYHQLVGSARIFEIPHRRLSWTILRQLAAWCRLNQIDLVHSHGRAAGAYSRLLARSKNRPCLHTAHGSLQLKSVRDFVYLFAEVALARRTDHFIAVSNSEAGQLRRRLLAGDRLTVIPNGVPLPPTPVSPGNLQRTPLRIIHITRFVPQKNSHMVLEILTCLRKQGALERFHVDFLGDGPERADLESQAHFLGLTGSMTFHGAQSSVTPFLTQGFCLLTTSRWEGMPLAVLEALAHGLPVVASNTPGNNDVVGPDLGCLFPVNDPATAANELIRLSADAPT